MTAFIRHLRAAWNYGRIMPYQSRADDPMFWTAEDAKWLNSMLQSQTGRKLLIKMRNYAMLVAAQSVCDPSNAMYRKDIAAGLFSSIAALEAFAGSGSSQTQDEQPQLEVVN